MDQAQRLAQHVIAQVTADNCVNACPTERSPGSLVPMANKKDLQQLLGLLTEQGFVIVKRASGHYAVFTAQGVHVTDIASSPSEHRGNDNARARLRRHGFQDPKKPAKKKHLRG